MPEYPRSPFERIGTSITPNVDGDALDATPIGENTPAAGSFTTLTSTTNKLDATTAPTVNDDTDLGYVVGSRWIDVTADKAYVCLDNTDDAAVWTETTGGAAGAVIVNVWLPAESAYLPATNPAGLVETLGATVYGGFSHLTFDDTTSEHAVWRVPMPDYDGGNITVTAFSKVASTPAGAVTLQYNILTIGLANSEAFDTAETVDTNVNISHSLNTTELLTDIMVASAIIDPTNVASDDLLVIELSRDVASDDLSGDGELVGILLEYTRS